MEFECGGNYTEANKATHSCGGSIDIMSFCPQLSAAPGDFYKHTAPEQGSQFGATFLMQMLLGVSWCIKINASKIADDPRIPRFELHFARRDPIRDPRERWPWRRWQVCFGRNEKSHGHGSGLWRWSQLEWPLEKNYGNGSSMMVGDGLSPLFDYLFHDVSWWAWWSCLFIIMFHVPSDSWW